MILIPLSIFFILQFPHHQTLNALIPEPGTLPLLNDTSVTLSDPKLKLEVFASGLKKPTNMAFLDSGDALVLEKQNGKVKRIVNGTVIHDPLLDVNVSNYDTRGMLGIAVIKNATAGKQYVFLYYTEAKDGQGDGEDKCFGASHCIKELTNGNKLYRYELTDNESKLINKKLIFAWPPSTSASHQGGEIIKGPDNNLYVTAGKSAYRGVMTNINKKFMVDGRAGILVFDHNGNSPFKNGIIGSEHPLNYYYAYGVRNSFGIDFDPITGNMWDTENGPWFGDEINLVKPGFNSGYEEIMGYWIRPSTFQIEIANDTDKANLLNFTGKGKYSDPELTWEETLGLTAIKFLNSKKYGEKYENDVFVGSFIGDLFHFDLKSNRTELDLKGPLKDRIANNATDELTRNRFGKGFDVISDITVGPDGYLYIVSLGRGEIYRVIPTNILH